MTPFFLFATYLIYEINNRSINREEIMGKKKKMRKKTKHDERKIILKSLLPFYLKTKNPNIPFFSAFQLTHSMKCLFLSQQDPCPH